MQRKSNGVLVSRTNPEKVYFLFHDFEILTKCLNELRYVRLKKTKQQVEEVDFRLRYSANALHVCLQYHSL